MISHKLKCIFIEVPKTASTSIREVLGFSPKPHLDIIETKREMISNWPFPKRLGKLSKLNEFNRLIPTKLRKNTVEKQFSNYYKFGFVRNPWDRVVSLYLRKEGIKMSDKLTFEEFTNWIQNSSDTSIHSSVHKNQLDWFLDENGKVIVDFIGKFENLEDDYKIIMKKLGVDKELPHANNGNNNKLHYAEYYTPKTIDIITKKFKVDIEYFGYEFGK
jgi:hypothetical protein